MAEMLDAIVIGAGVGGLAAAIDLAARGATVRVLEAAPTPGGKAGSVVLDGVEVDTGPSLLTLPEVFEALFQAAGRRLGDEVELLRPCPAFRYYYPGGVELDLFHDVGETLASVRGTLGAKAGDELEAFLAYAGRVWRAGAPFVLEEAPTLAGVAWLALCRPWALLQIDAARSMASAIRARVKDEHLRALLLRFATYNGSSPERAPATLNCISHVELGLGGFGVAGGIAALVRALVRVACSLWVELAFGQRVRRVIVENGRAVGVVTEAGDVHRARVVIANADVAHLAEDLLPPSVRHGLSRPKVASMSGWTAILRARRGQTPRPAHAVVFPERYAAEFEDVFERRRPPESPAIYLCAAESAHGRRGWSEDEAVFVMVNAPAADGAGADDALYGALEVKVLERLRGRGLVTEGDRIVWRRSPRGLAERFFGSRGSLYGAASHGAMAAFHRPPNRTRVPGLFLASGSAHPGGGLPLVALSGRAAARAAARYLDALGTEAAVFPYALTEGDL